MYVYKTDIAVLAQVNSAKFDHFPSVVQLRAHMALATYGVVCQSEQSLIGVLPVSVCEHGRHTILDMYTMKTATHAQVCEEMLQLVLGELGGARALVWVPLAKSETAASALDIYLGCCFQTVEKTDSHVLVEYEALR